MKNMSILAALLILVVVQGVTAISQAAGEKKQFQQAAAVTAEGIIQPATSENNKKHHSSHDDDGSTGGSTFDGTVRCEFFDGYPSVCANMTNCQYCCASQQCLSTTMEKDAGSMGPEHPEQLLGVTIFPGNVSCPTTALLSDHSLSCDSTCQISLDTESESSMCSRCLARSWCLHCSAAQTHKEDCLHRDSAVCPKTMTDSCVPHVVPNDASFVDAVIPWVVLFCIVAGLLVIIIPLFKWFISAVKRKLEERRDIQRRRDFREQQQRREQEEQERRDQSSGATTSSIAPTQGGVSSTDAISTTATAGQPASMSSPINRNGNGRSITDSSTELSEHQPLLVAAVHSNGTLEAEPRSIGEAAEEERPAPASVARTSTPESGQKENTKNDATPTTPSTATSVPPASSVSSFSDEDACQLCLDARATIIYYPCYHCYCCEECSSKLRPTGNRREGTHIVCPFCRQRVRAMVNTEPLPESIKQSLRKRQ